MTSKLGNIQDHNISAVFNVLDANRDSVITEEDFEQIAARVCAQFGISADSEAGRKVRGSYLAWWQQLRRDFDADGDGRVTLAEFTSAYKDGKGNPERYFAEQLGPTVKVVVDMIDTDRDGFISEAEYLRLLAVATSDRETALAGFRQLDTDGDGRVSVAEFQVGIQQLMLSNDPTASGTGILGQVR
jgi:Ca2+-binding EF-hand superfamily protein